LLRTMNVQDFETVNCVPSILTSPEVDRRKAMARAENNSRQGWWKQSVVRRSMSSIEPDLDGVIAKSPFLQRHTGDDLCAKNIALFHRSEIETGEILGRGGFSQVYAITAFDLDPKVSARCSEEEQSLREHYAASACDAKGRSRYCIKHLQERLVQSPKDFQCAASDLAVEAAFMSALDHPNILSVRALPIDGLKAWSNGNHDGYFLVTDRLDGTLDKKVIEWKRTNKGPGLEEKAELAMQLANALRYLHANRIIYRDLKPHNIGITSNGGHLTKQVKLFDFGLCRELPSREMSHTGVYEMSGVGTRRYMACEIINNGKYNLKADVYGWAMVFWEMLSLTKPFAPYSTEDHQREVCRGGERPIIQLQWPNWIHAVLERSWDESVDYRYTMEEVYEILQVNLFLQEKENVSNELAFSRHNRVVKKSAVLPPSPAAINEFPSSGSVGLNSLGFSSVDMVQSIDQLPNLFEDSPPPPPKKPTHFVNLPEMVVRNIALSRGMTDSDDDVSLVSLDDDSFAEHVESEIWG
jgi:serine/threonine protein kinase